VSRPAIKRIVFTWRGLPGWTYLILDFPVGIRAVGIEVSEQVARKECVSIFDAKRGAESRQPRTELTPMCFGACRRKLPKWRVPASNLGPPPLEITFQECARNFRIFKCSAIRTMEIMRVRKRMEARVYNRLAKQARRHEGSMRTDHPSGRRQETSERTAHSSQTVNNVKIRRYACIAVDNLFTIPCYVDHVDRKEAGWISGRDHSP
jgi:hypothetical protein